MDSDEYGRSDMNDNLPAKSEFLIYRTDDAAERIENGE